MSEGGNGTQARPSRASEWKARNRKVVTLPSGLAVTIGKVTGLFLLDMKELFEKLLLADERGAKLVLSAADNKQYLEMLVCRAVLQPRVVPAAVEAGEDELHIEDFGADLNALVESINEYNAEVLVTPFRSAQDGAAAAPTGGSIQDAPQPVAEGTPA